MMVPLLSIPMMVPLSKLPKKNTVFLKGGVASRRRERLGFRGLGFGCVGFRCLGFRVYLLFNFAEGPSSPHLWIVLK